MNKKIEEMREREYSSTHKYLLIDFEVKGKTLNTLNKQNIYQIKNVFKLLAMFNV